ncbi:inositol monophosphatase [Gordonia amarae]|uniref:Inositol monophosphatase ImpA n=2 Tax=Gordonia amarae TaxID=36821 RepID=G7GRZ6_9ACTN|nr:inositol monophosphatase family protein [Gordonia amarae]MCS3879500.1 myo-inositol-1(or 4)-monophosphatase [Gordonia amarae]QHN17974.1 inositol monophosphatase [Gordonia amarae]QHN22494.1 inositol monophosphatase [Gordonia amarae]QHN31359.1 inositol monophosphatase [Gordonia amarae]QHN40105.1 inositol monophosphatase [Gordonia amarae]
MSAGLDYARLLHTAGSILDGAVEEFRAGVGAPSAVAKSATDFATQVDLDLERRLSAELADQTQIPVHGEEFGGPDLDSGAVWVLDPVDGTYNYSTGLPLTGILLGLLVDGDPVLGLTWLPLQNRRYAAHVDGPLLVDGEPVAPLADTELATSVLAYGPFNAAHGGRYSGDVRADVLRGLSSRVARLRMTGSTGVDLSFTAAGIFGGAVIFGRHAWDNAPGAALVRAAGGIATDLSGNPWTVTSSSLVVGAPGLHAELLDVITDASRGEWKDGE